MNGAKGDSCRIEGVHIDILALSGDVIACPATHIGFKTTIGDHICKIDSAGVRGRSHGREEPAGHKPREHDCYKQYR